MDGRKYRRVRLSGGPPGLLNAGTPVRVLDLTPAGAMLEHPRPLPPGEIVLLGLRVNGVDLRLRARVAWCSVDGTGADLDGEAEPRFRCGLHFAEVPAGIEVQLRHYLAVLNAPKSDLTQELG